MKKRFKDFCNSAIGAVTVPVCVLIIFGIVVFYLAQAISWGYQEIWPLDSNTLATHDKKLEVVLDDFSQLYKLENAEVNIGEKQVIIVFHADDCDLKVTLDKELSIVSREIIDNRFFASTIKVQGLLLSSPIIVFMAFLLFLFFGLMLVTIDDKIKRKVNK